jgi:Holliday junction resolvase
LSNKNYERGRKFEYEIQNKLRNKRWYCYRGAGSHAIDLTALYPKASPLFIECKAGYFKKEDYSKVASLVKNIGGIFLIVQKTKNGVKWIKL